MLISLLFSLLCTPALAQDPEEGVETTEVAAPAPDAPGSDESGETEPLPADEGTEQADDEGTTEESSAPAKALMPGQVTPDFKHYDLELLYHQGQMEEGLELALQRIEEDPTDKDPYWLAARFIFEIGEQIDRNDKSVDKNIDVVFFLLIKINFIRKIEGFSINSDSGKSLLTKLQELFDVLSFSSLDNWGENR